MNFFLQEFDVVELILNVNLFVVVLPRIVVLALLLVVLLLVVQQVYVETVQLLVLFLHKLCYLLLDQTQIHPFNRRNAHVHQVAQHEVVQVHRTHRGQVGQHPH